MSSVASTMGKFLPVRLRNEIRPIWYKIDSFIRFFQKGGRFKYNWELGSWVARRQIAGKSIELVVRSYREFNRWRQFGKDGRDVVFKWLLELNDCEAYWDIGSANGIEGLFVSQYHQADVLFLEPYAPSIETILKSIHNLKRSKIAQQEFEVVQALCDKKSHFQKLVMHRPPRPGQTENSAKEGIGLYYGGNRHRMPVEMTQWVPSVSLDDLHWKYGIKLPTHIKIDVDGYELAALEGAERILRSNHVKSWVIEVNDNKGKQVLSIMKKHGYQKVGEFDHNKPKGFFSADYIFVREDLLGDSKVEN